MIAVGLDVLVNVITMHSNPLFKGRVLIEVSPDYDLRNREML